MSHRFQHTLNNNNKDFWHGPIPQIVQAQTFSDLYNQHTRTHAFRHKVLHMITGWHCDWQTTHLLSCMQAVKGLMLMKNKQKGQNQYKGNTIYIATHWKANKQKLQYTDCLKATWNRGIFSQDPKQASEGAFLRPAGSEFKTLGGQECKWTLTRSFETGFRDFGKLFMSNCQTDQPPTTRFIVVECFCQFCWSCCITERLVLRRKCFCNEFCWDLDTHSYDCNVWTDFGFACVCVCVCVCACICVLVCSSTQLLWRWWFWTSTTCHQCSPSQPTPLGLTKTRTPEQLLMEILLSPSVFASDFYCLSVPLVCVLLFI